MSSFAQYTPPKSNSIERPPRSDTRPVVVWGLSALLIMFGGLGTWTALAPLSTAAIAPGVAKVNGEIKTVQHLEGGIVREILVKDGNHVVAGQVVIRLDDTAARAQLESLRGIQRSYSAMAARLEAEQQERPTVQFSPELNALASDPGVAEVMAGQLKQFTARREAIESQKAVLHQRIQQGKAEITGLLAQIRSADMQHELLVEEIKGLRVLYEKGYAPKTRLLALERTDANVLGDRGMRQSSIARAQQAISEYEMRIIDVQTQTNAQVANELENVRLRLNDLGEKLRAATDVLERTEIRAPRSGTVVDLRVHTRDGVVGPGQKLLDIVPDDEMVIIEVQVRPSDIDVVFAGLPAQIHLPVHNARNLPLIDGKVVHVSADRMVDTRSGLSYFLARVEVSAQAIAATGVDLKPGMPAEVMIVTGERTALDYLTRPLLDSFRRSLREQS